MRLQESQNDLGRTIDPSLGSRSTATLIKLPTDAPINSVKKINTRSGFPKNQADVDDKVLNWKVVRMNKWGNKFPRVAPQIGGDPIGHFRLSADRRATHVFNDHT